MTILGAPWRRGWTAIALVAVLWAAGPVSMAAAHDELTGTEPADGATVEVAPEQLQMEFSGTLASVGSFVTVTGPQGTVTQGPAQVDGVALAQPLVADVPPGEYDVVWRVTSQDGHPISGEFTYSVSSAGSEAPGEQAPAQPSETAASTSTSDRAANTAAAPAQGDSSAGAGTTTWVWGVIALALVTLGSLGVVALRRR